MEQENQAPAILESVRFFGTPEDMGELFKALALAQGEFAPILKDSTAKVQMKAGGQYTFDYAGLDVVIAATQPALSKHGIAMMQFPTFDSLVTVLGKGAARIESYCALPRDAQAFGSAITYMKRYARLSVLSVFPADEDDDGAAASGHKAVTTQKASNPPAVTKAPEAAKISQGALTPQTKARIGDLGKKVGFNREELEAFSVKHGCGPLNDLPEVKGVVLAEALQALQVQA